MIADPAGLSALEADLQRFYGLELVPALFGPRRLSPRRLVALVRNLPRSSAVARYEIGERRDWGYTEELLALNAELSDYGNRIALMAATRGKAKPRPLKITRPGDDGAYGKPRPPTSGEELARNAARALGIPVKVAREEAG